MSDEYRVLSYKEGRLRSDFDECYDMLVGPGGFECLLTEPEDRIWCRDGKAVVERLNQQAAEIARLQAIVDQLPQLVQIVAMDSGADPETRPSIYQRGSGWRYHIQRCGNQWADGETPLEAAEKARG